MMREGQTRFRGGSSPSGEGDDKYSARHAASSSSVLPRKPGLLRLAVTLIAAVVYGFVAFWAGKRAAGAAGGLPNTYQAAPQIYTWPDSWEAAGERRNVSIFVAILTAAKNRAQRDSLRETWLTSNVIAPGPLAEDPGTEVRAAYRFFVGHNENVEDSVLEAEAAEHGDLEILDFQDTYTSLPQKRILAIKWAVEKSGLRFNYFMRMDDDLYVDIDKIVSVYESGRPRTGLYAGAAWFRGIPHRKGRWAIARSVYFPGEWPPYIEGAISLLSTDLIQYVYINRDWLKPLGHLEDVSMGMWLLGLQVHPIPERGILSGNVINLRGKKAVCTDDLLAMPELKVEEVRAMFAAKQQGLSICTPFKDEEPPKRERQQQQAPKDGL